MYRCRCQHRWTVALGVSSGAGLEVDLFRPIVIELMDSELTAVGGIRVVDRPSGTDGERDTSVTSVAMTAGAVMGLTQRSSEVLAHGL